MAAIFIIYSTLKYKKENKMSLSYEVSFYNIHESKIKDVVKALSLKLLSEYKIGDHLIYVIAGPEKQLYQLKQEPYLISTRLLVD